MNTNEKHLWEIDHPYYCAELANNEDYDSWQEWLEECENLDTDLNLIFRWDWRLVGVDPDIDDEIAEFEGQGQLTLFFVQQRKGRLWSNTIENMKPEDEASVRQILELHAQKLREIWEPLSLG